MPSNDVDKRMDLLKKAGVEKRHGITLRTRDDLAKTRRFICDSEGRLVHDLAREKPSCGVDDLLSRGVATTFCESLEKAISAGYGVCPDCIGRSPTDTFAGDSTVLFVLYLPARGATPLDGVLEREAFGLRLGAIHNDRDDEARLVSAIDGNKARGVFYQAFRRQSQGDELTGSGAPDKIVSLGGGTQGADDVLVDMFVPRSVSGNADALHETAEKLVQELMSIGVIRRALEVHARRYRYRDLAVYFHSCESVDDWVRHRPNAKCSSSSSGASSGSVTPTGGSSGGTYYAGVTYHK